MRKLYATVLASVFLVAFAVGMVTAAPTKTVRACTTYHTSYGTVKCCIVEDHVAQVSYEECFIYIAY